MVRKFLALFATGLILFAALLIQMTAAQAAAPSQNDPDTAVEEPLPQPMRIRINQSIPLTLLVPAALVDVTGPVTRPLTTTNAVTDTVEAAAEELTTTAELAGAEGLTGTEELTATEDVTGGAAVSTTEGVTATEEAASDAPADAAAEASAALTTTGAVTGADVLTSALPMVSVPVTLEFSLDMVVTQTMTSTVPSTVTIVMADATTRTLPVEISVAALPDGEVYVGLLPGAATPEPAAEVTAEVTATAAVTPAETVTPTLEVSVTVGAPSGLPVIETTATTTINLRAGPATTFDLVGQAGPDQALPVVGVSEDGQWYLLDGGAWVAAYLTADTALPNLPVATQELIDQASGNAPVPTATATPRVTATAAVTTVVTPAATPVPATSTAVTPTTTTDANLRAGPGTEFPIIGGTVLGQEINIVGRNADATWWRLDNTGWIFGDLVANPPAPETVPVVNADGTPVEGAAAPAATETPAPTGGGLLLPTPTPGAAGTGENAGENAAASATPEAATAGLDANYVGDVQAVVTTYDGIVQTMDGLIGDARKDVTVLTTPEWADRVNATLVILRRTGARVGELVAPAGAAAAQASLIDAASQYTAAGNALSQAAQTGATAQLDVAEAAIQAANTSLAAVEQAVRGTQQ